MERSSGQKRYNLVLPIPEFEALIAFAKSKKERVKTSLLRFIRLGIEAQKVVNRGGEIVIKDDKGETKIIL